MSSDYILGLQIMCRFFIALGFSYIGLEAAGSRNLVLYYRTKISLIVVFSLSGLFFTYIAADIAYTIGHPRALLIAIFVRRMCMFVSGDSFLSLIGKGITGTVLYGMIMLAIHIKNPVVTKFRHPTLVGPVRDELLEITKRIFEESWHLTTGI